MMADRVSYKNAFLELPYVSEVTRLKTLRGSRRKYVKVPVCEVSVRDPFKKKKKKKKNTILATTTITIDLLHLSACNLS